MATMEEPPSPCNKICRINDVTGWCDGCARTLPEIAAWSAAGAAEKRAILDRVAQRVISGFTPGQ